jgi:signal transduction histidine kinase
VTKYAQASSVTITLEGRGSELTFSVRDDGRGFDTRTTAKGARTQNMADRLAALGRSVSVGQFPVEAPQYEVGCP